MSARGLVLRPLTLHRAAAAQGATRAHGVRRAHGRSEAVVMTTSPSARLGGLRLAIEPLPPCVRFDRHWSRPDGLQCCVLRLYGLGSYLQQAGR